MFQKMSHQRPGSGTTYISGACLVKERFLWLHRTITHTAWRSRPPRLTDCSVRTCPVCACDLLPAQVIRSPFQMKTYHPVRDRASGPSQNDESIQTPIAVNALNLLAHSSSGLRYHPVYKSRREAFSLAASLDHTHSMEVSASMAMAYRLQYMPSVCV